MQVERLKIIFKSLEAKNILGYLFDYFYFLLFIRLKKCNN